jgi:peptidoglycan/xylan/chitin deacetylase (PgdA/CDA1 family)
MKKIPLILSYHRIHPKINGDSITNTPKQLDSHIKLLRLLGYTFISLSDWWILKPHKKHRYAIITFDDGWQDNFTYALPVLRSNKVNATIFLISNYIGSNKMPEGMVKHKDRSFLSIEQIKKMCGMGFDFQSHTSTHKVLTTLSDSIALEELSHSRKELTLLLGKTPIAICYPKSQVNREIITQAKAAGYQLGVLTQPFNKLIPPPCNMALPRIGLYSSDSVLRFFCKLLIRKIQTFIQNILQKV